MVRKKEKCPNQNIISQSELTQFIIYLSIFRTVFPFSFFFYNDQRKPTVCVLESIKIWYNYSVKCILCCPSGFFIVLSRPTEWECVDYIEYGYSQLQHNKITILHKDQNLSTCHRMNSLAINRKAFERRLQLH